MRRAVPILLAAIAAACAGEDEGPPRAAPAQDAPRAAPAELDLDRPLEALALDADDVARRLGSFEWTAGVEWSVSRQGEDAERVRAVERHRVRQSAAGDFEVLAEVDPGLGPGSDAGKEIVHAAGRTYARAKHAPWRERPTDRGRDARRFRDESFAVAAALLRLAGPVAATPAGETTVLGRPARRFSLSLARGVEPAAAPAARPAGAPEPDEDTRRRLRFLDGRVPAALDGELVLDRTGAPLRVRIAAAFSVKDAPKVRAAVELSAQVQALGGEVPAIAPPKGPLPDERKPAGVANALEAAGLRKRDEAPARREPGDEEEAE